MCICTLVIAHTCTDVHNILTAMQFDKTSIAHDTNIIVVNNECFGNIERVSTRNRVRGTMRKPYKSDSVIGYNIIYIITFLHVNLIYV